MDTQMLKERKLNIETVDINFAEGPKSGPPLVLLHGLPGHWQEFMPIMPTMVLQWHVHALDLRGQGKSGRVPDQYQGKYYVTDIVEFLRNQFTAPAILYGHSAGGLVALGAAAQLPELVKAVILGDSPIDMEVLVGWMTSDGFKHHFSALQEIAGLENHSTKEITEKIASIPVQVPGKDEVIKYGDSPGVDPIQIQQLAVVLSQMDPGVLEYHASGRAMEFFEDFELNDILEQIKCPLLLMQGNPSFGSMMTDNAVKHVKSILPSAEHTFIESAGHDLGLDTWEVAPLLRVIMNFLSSL
jgi:pimeloyl-ACP methyl ester carboxylesterase